MASKKVYLILVTALLLVTRLPGAPLAARGASIAHAQASSSCADLYQESLVGYWGFDDPADLMKPTVGSLQGTTVGSIPATPGMVGQALAFNGNAYVNYGPTLDIPAWDSYTVSIWFLNDGRVPWVKGYGQKIIDKTTWYSDWFISLQDPSNPTLPANLVFMYDTSFKNIQTGGYGYNDSQWHHAVITKDGVHGELWVDGVLIGAKDDVNPTINNQPLLLGYSLSGDGYQRIYWGGALDEFAVFNRALTAAEIGDLYSRSQGGEPYCINDRFVVNTTATYTDGTCDPLGCTLFEAIMAANRHPGPDTIAFNIPGPGPYVINHAQLTEVRGPVTIDGYTQPGSHPSTTTDPAEMDAKPLIVLDGANVVVEGPRIEPPHAFTFCLDGTDCVIQGLVFQNYWLPPIQMGGNVLLTGNFIGTDVTGTIARPNATRTTGLGTIDRSGGHVVGNLFSGSGILMWGGNIEVRNNRFGVGMDGEPLPLSSAISYIPSDGYATVVGNYFAYPTAGGISVPGGYIANNRLLNAGGIGCGWNHKALCIIEDNVISGSRGDGIGVYLSNGTVVRHNLIENSATSGISVNGRDTLSSEFDPLMLIEENIIRGNAGAGILQYGYTWPPTSVYDSIYMTARNNRIYDNGGLGIDLSAIHFQPDGVTPNDLGDLNDQQSGMQNFPVLVRTGGNPQNTVIQGELNTRPNRTVIIDFYTNTACDPAGYGEGERHLGSTSVTTGGDGNAYFTTSLPMASAMGEALTATATNSDGATSEFSQCILNAGIINGVLTQEAMTVDRSRLGEGIFVLNATFRNTGATTLTNGFFRVTQLAYQRGELEPAGLVMQNAIGGARGTGALVAMPTAVAPDTTFVMTFVLHLPRLEPFNFLVDGYGVADGLTAATDPIMTAAPTFDLTMTAADLAETNGDGNSAVEKTYLPLINR
jgi:parallel beta-helix repeat protein